MKLSVAIVTYNQEEFIAKALESALMQDVDFEYEILVGEDCSTDKTSEIVKVYADNNPGKIKAFLREKNLGMNRNFFSLLKECKGEYIALLDGDDLWTDSEKLKKQVALLDSRSDAAISFHNMLVEYTDGSYPEHPFHTANPVHDVYSPPPPSESGIEKIIAGNFLQTASVVFRNGLIDEVPDWFYDLKMGDWPLHILNASKGKILYLDEVMGKYRVHPKSVWSSRSNLARYHAIVQVYERFNEYFDGRYSEIIEKELAWYYSNIINEKSTAAYRLIEEKSFFDALDELNECVEISERKGYNINNLYFARAVCHVQMEDFDNALADLEIEIELNPDNQNAIELKGQISRVRPDSSVKPVSLDETNVETEESELDFSIIIPVHNNFSYTVKCLEGVLKTAGPNRLEIIIVDNASDDGTAQHLSGLRGLKIIHNDDNKPYAVANNQGAVEAVGEYLIFLNNDTNPLPGWLDAIKQEFETDERCGVQGAKLLYEDGKIQHAGMIFGSRPGRKPEPYHAYLLVNADEDYVSRKRRVQFVTGACLAIRKKLFIDVDGFDEGYNFGWEDTDLCMKVKKAGYKIIYNPEAVLYHYESVTKKQLDLLDTSSEREQKNREHFFSRWESNLVRDDKSFYAEDGFELLGGKLVQVRKESKPEEPTVPKKKVINRTSFGREFWRRNYKNSSIVLLKVSHAIGDALTMTAIVAEMKRQYPHLRIHVSGNNVTEVIFYRHPALESFVESGSEEEFNLEAFADIVIDYHNLLGSLVEYYNGLPYMDILGNVTGIKFRNRDIVYHIRREERKWAASEFDTLFTTGPLVGVQFMTEKDAKRCYPYGAKLVEEIIEKMPDVRILNLGKEELNIKNSTLIDCASRRFTLREQIALARHCDAFLTIDSAFFHIGHNLFKKPTLVIAGLTNPALIGNPVNGFEFIRNESLDCLECYWRKPCHIECMRELSHKTIANKFIELLASTYAGTGE